MILKENVTFKRDNYEILENEKLKKNNKTINKEYHLFFL